MENKDYVHVLSLKFIVAILITVKKKENLFTIGICNLSCNSYSNIKTSVPLTI